MVRNNLKLHWQTGQWITSGTQLVLLAIGAQSESREGWLICLTLMALLSLWAWTGALKRRRAICDTPTSRIASAAQGYVELQGTGQPLAGLPLVSPLSARPCLWYRHLTEQKDGDNHWKEVDHEESDASFLVDDGSGLCAVDPAGAEIHTQHKLCRTEGDFRHTEWRLLPGDSIYALGEFATLTARDTLPDRAEALKQMLGEWKADPAELHRRFDLNGDGQLDQEEWQLVRQAARREVSRQQAALSSAEVHLLRRPASGQLYLLSNLPEAKLARRYGLWALFHLLLFFGALGAIPWISQHF